MTNLKILQYRVSFHVTNYHQKFQIDFHPPYVNGFNYESCFKYGSVQKSRFRSCLVKSNICEARKLELCPCRMEENALKNRQVDGVTQRSSIFVSSFTLINVILLLIARESRARQEPPANVPNGKRHFAPSFFQFPSNEKVYPYYNFVK